MCTHGLTEFINHKIMRTIWLVIYVSRGCIQDPEVFFDEASAVKRKKEILKCFNRDYDEVKIFEKTSDCF